MVNLIPTKVYHPLSKSSYPSVSTEIQSYKPIASTISCFNSATKGPKSKETNQGTRAVLTNSVRNI